MSAPHFPPLGLTLADLYPDRREEILQQGRSKNRPNTTTNLGWETLLQFWTPALSS